MRNKRRRIRERKRKEERRLDRIAARTEQLLAIPITRSVPVYSVGDVVFVNDNQFALAEGVIRERDHKSNTYKVSLRVGGAVITRRWSELVPKRQPPMTFPKMQLY